MADQSDPDDEKTEDPTPRRRHDAREDGQVALSSELLTATVLCAGLGAMVFAGGALASTTGAAIQRAAESLAQDPRGEFSPSSCTALIAATARSVATPILCVIVPIVCGVLLVGYAQVGFQVTPKAIMWDLARLDPLKGWKKLLSKRSLVRTAIALVKIVVIASAIAAAAWSDFPSIARLSGSELGPMLAGLGQVTLHAAAVGLVSVFVIAVLDFGYQRWQHEQELKMSKKELKDEHKRVEGDPHVKARVRQIQRELARRRMMAEVPKATVVVTNPTHYAVALRYERDESGAAGAKKKRAPYVVAKGTDLVAERIKSVARDADVPCFEDVALARLLHARVEIGDEIPEDLYQAVASVLAYVYRVQGAQLSPVS